MSTVDSSDRDMVGVDAKVPKESVGFSPTHWLMLTTLFAFLPRVVYKQTKEWQGTSRPSNPNPHPPTPAPAVTPRAGEKAHPKQHQDIMSLVSLAPLTTTSGLTPTSAAGSTRVCAMKTTLGVCLPIF